MDFVALCCWILGPVTVRDGRSGPMSFPQEFSAETSFLWGLRGGGGGVPPGHRIGKIKYIIYYWPLFSTFVHSAIVLWPVGAGLPAGAKVKERLCRWTVGRDGK